MPLITPSKQSEILTDNTTESVTKWLQYSAEPQEDKFQRTSAVYNIHLGTIRRKTMNSIMGDGMINNAQSLSCLNPEATEFIPQEYLFYDPTEESVRALDDHSSDSAVPRCSARIQARLINNRPHEQDISNVDQYTKGACSCSLSLRHKRRRRPENINYDVAVNGKHRRCDTIDSSTRVTLID